MRPSFFRSVVSAVAIFATVGVTALVGTPAAFAADAPTFNTPCMTSSNVNVTGTYTVPAGVTTVRAALSGEPGEDAVAGTGGTYSPDYRPMQNPLGRGGAGSSLVVDVAVTPGQVLQVGRLPGARAGRNGLNDERRPGEGGGGGDAQFLSTAGSDGCQHPLAVAAGGGGGGGSSAPGGNADAGTGATGGANGGANDEVDGGGGGGATQTFGGSSGARGHKTIILFGRDCGPGISGEAGTFLGGGKGGDQTAGLPGGVACPFTIFTGGGGGAGLYYGGGGGSAYGDCACHHPGAGGGGSSFYDREGGVTKVSQSVGHLYGDAKVSALYDTAVSVSKTPEGYTTRGQEVTITATVTIPALNRATTAGGTVEFTTDAGTSRVAVDGSGRAVLTTRDIPEGTGDIRARYFGTVTSAESTRDSSSADPPLRHEVRVCAPAPTVTRQPRDLEGTAGTAYILSMGVAIPNIFGGTPTVTWQASRDGGRTWTDDPGRALMTSDGSATLLTNSENPGQVQYRATLTTCGGTTLSQVATVAVAGVAFDLSTLPPKTYGDDPFDVSGYARAVSTTQPLVYSAFPSNVCVTSGSTVLILGAGACTISAGLPQGRMTSQNITVAPYGVTVTARSFTHPQNQPAPANMCTAPFLKTDTWVTAPTATVSKERPSSGRPGDTGGWVRVNDWTTASASARYKVECAGGAANGYSVVGYTAGWIQMTASLPPAITAKSTSSTYGNPVPALTATVEAGLEGTASCSAYTSADTGFASPLTLTDRTPAGKYVTHCTGVTNPTGAMRTIDGKLTIWPAEVTVTASSPETKEYGSPGAPVVTCTSTGFLDADRFLTAPTGEVRYGGAPTVIGQYSAVAVYTTLCAGGDPGENYSVTRVPGTFAIADRTAPVVTIGEIAPVQATAYLGALIVFTTRSSDATGTPPVTCTPESGTYFPVGDTTVTCSAVDEFGNRGVASRVVTVTGVPQSVAFTSTPPDGAKGGDTYSVTAEGTADGNPVEIGARGACTIELDVVTFVGDGTCTITADQPGRGKWAPAPQVVQTVVVTGVPGSVAFASEPPAEARVGDTLALGIVAGPSSSAPVLRTTGPCRSLGDGVVHLVLEGVCTLTLDQPGDTVHGAAPQVVRTVRITRFPQAVTFVSEAPARATAGEVYAATATSDSGGAVVISVAGACVVDQMTVTFINEGLCTITGDQVGDQQWAPARPAQQSVLVHTRPGFVEFASSVPEPAYVQGTWNVHAKRGPSTAPPVLGASGACVVSDADTMTVTFTEVGICRLTLDQAGDKRISAAPQAVQSFEVVKKPQKVWFTSEAPAEARIGDTYIPTATSGPGANPVVLGVTGVCKILDGTVTFFATGTCTVTADQAGDDSSEAAPQVSQTIAVGVKAASVAFESDAPRDATVGGSYTPVVIKSGSSAAPMLTAAGACSVDAGVVTFDRGGTCTVSASQEGDDVFAASPIAVQVFDVARRSQTVTFTSSTPVGAVAGATYTPAASADPSGLPVALAASGTCTMTDGVITFQRPGTCTVAADQVGDERYAPATQITQVIEVGASPSAVSFGGDVPSDARVGGSFTPEIVAGPSSAAPVLTASGACSLSAGGVVSYDAAGTCTLTLDQGGDDTHAASASVVRTFEVRKTPQSLAFTSSAPAATVGGPGYTPTVRSGGSTAPVVLGTTTPAVCAVSSGAVSFLAAGSCVLTAEQAGDRAFEPAPQVTQTVAVTAAAGKPTKKQTISFTAKMPASPEVGIDYPVAAKATSGLPVTLAATGGCTLTPTGAGTGTVRLTDATRCTIQATQAGDSTWRAGSGTQTLQLKAGTVADMTVKLTLTPRLAATAPLTGKVTVKNVGTRDAATVTTRVTVTGLVASAPGAVQTPGMTPGTTVLTWTEARVAPSQVLVYPVTLAGRTPSTTIDATVSSAQADPTPANNTAKATVK